MIGNGYLGVEAIPAIAFALLLYTVPESPRWLVKQDREAEARHVIKKVSNADIEQEIHEIKESLVTIGASGENCFSINTGNRSSMLSL